ncbi:hypothetical protein LUR56_03405 [Streptomyces sp. MT29]|nr:hypothetical protein [Streptomyces sp. MT29]
MLRAARLASDCPRALLGLVRLHRAGGGAGAGAGPAAGGEKPDTAGGGERSDPAAVYDEGARPREVLTVLPAPETVTVALSPAPPAADMANGRRVVRLTRVPDGPTGITEITDLSPAGGWVDPSPPFGQEVRYAALPLRDGRIDGRPSSRTCCSSPRTCRGCGPPPAGAASGPPGPSRRVR